MGYTVVGDPEGLDYNNRWLISLGGGRRFDKRLSGSAFYSEERASVEGESNARDLTFSLNAGPFRDVNFHVSFLIGLSDGAPDTGFTVGGRFKFGNPSK